MLKIQETKDLTVPQTTVKLYSGVPLERTSSNRILMGSEMEFDTAISRYVVKTYAGVLTQDEKVNSSLLLDGFAMDYATVNYISIYTPSSSNVTLYGFIDNVEYVNDNTFRITYTLDLFSTYIYKVEKNHRGYVIRHHVNDDVYGKYTLEEGLEIGPYMSDMINYTTFTGNTCLVVVSTKDRDNNDVGGGVYGGLYYAGRMFAFAMTEGGRASFENYINMLNQSGTIGAISSIYMVPKQLLSQSLPGGWDVLDVPNSFIPVELDQMEIRIPKDKNGFYAPKNKKLLYYPYQYLMVNNSGGATQEFHWELFSTPTYAKFRLQGVPSSGECVMCSPYSYAYAGDDIGRGSERLYYLGLGNFPSVSWQNDPYSNWLAQTQNQRTTQLVTSAISGVSGAVGDLVSLDIGGMVQNLANPFNTILNQSAKENDYAIKPNQISGQQTLVNVLFSLGSLGKAFSFYNRYLREEYAKKIDDYFSAFGYKITETILPNFYGRKSWNYLRMTDFAIHGKVPTVAKNEISALLTNGVTLWHTVDVGNYGLDNSVL